MILIPKITRISDNIISAVHNDNKKIIKYLDDKDRIYKEYKNYEKIMSNTIGIVENFNIYREYIDFDKKSDFTQILLEDDIIFSVPTSYFNIETENLYIIIADYNPSKISLFDFINDKNNNNEIILKFILQSLDNLNTIYDEHGYIHGDFHIGNILVDTNKLDISPTFIDLEMFLCMNNDDTLEYQELCVDYLKIDDTYTLTKRFLHFFDMYLFTVSVYECLSYNRKVSFILYLHSIFIANTNINKSFLYFYIIYINLHYYLVNNTTHSDLSINISHKNMKTLLGIFNNKYKTILNMYNNNIFDDIINEIYDIILELNIINEEFMTYIPRKHTEDWNNFKKVCRLEKIIIKCRCSTDNNYICEKKDWKEHIKLQHHKNYISKCK